MSRGVCVWYTVCTLLLMVAGRETGPDQRGECSKNGGTLRIPLDLKSLDEEHLMTLPTTFGDPRPYGSRIGDTPAAHEALALIRAATVAAHARAAYRHLLPTTEGALV